jgi:hypothetical protein
MGLNLEHRDRRALNFRNGETHEEEMCLPLIGHGRTDQSSLNSSEGH